MDHTTSISSTKFPPTPPRESGEFLGPAARPVITPSPVLTPNPSDEIYLEAPATKRRRLHHDDPELKATRFTSQSNHPSPGHKDAKPSDIDEATGAEGPKNGLLRLSDAWLENIEIEQGNPRQDDDQPFLEQAWWNGDLEIKYDVYNEIGEDLEEKVCYGMLDDLTISVHEARIGDFGDGIFNARVCSNCVFLQGNSNEVGLIEPATAKAIRVLSEDPDIVLQVRCTIKRELLTPRRRKSLKTSSVWCAHLSVIIYGTLKSFDLFGHYLEECGFYLQDPEGCDQNVPYRNPHRLSGTQKNPPMTIEQQLDYASIQQEAYSSVDLIGSHQELPEAVTPSPIITPLFPHQRKALTFLLTREKGWEFHGTRPDIWKDAGRGRYLNTISREMQVGCPPSFQGGILADYMGLGKTLSMIALVASDLSLDQSSISVPSTPMSGDTSTIRLRCTLIVVPPNLLHTWNIQLGRHIRPKMVRYRKHHGKDRIKHRSELVGLDVLITTYQTIAAEFQRRHTSASVLFTVNWHRIILDEAHFIRDRSTATAKAVCALEGRRRWAMTGTPLQHGINDLASLFQFIRAYPYSDPKVFDQDIVHTTASGGQSTSIERLKRLFSCVAIRRSNNTIDLPKRVDTVLPVEFDSEERTLYNAVQERAKCVLEEAKNANDMSHQTYRSALRYITALRMICNLGTAAILPEDHNMQKSSSRQRAIWNTITATEAYEDLLAAGHACCQHCKIAIDSVEESNHSNRLSPPWVAHCLRILCGECFRNFKLSTQLKPWCGHRSHCATASVDPNLRLKKTSESSLAPVEVCRRSSTKIAALVRSLKMTESEKSIIFSTWTSTLDAIEKALTEAQIGFVRYDGAVSPTNRVAALDTFRHKSTISVMLITTACGAVGLDLTAASRAYLMEPHWNPTVEEQALARIHRLGQTREVTTIRLVVGGSYEQHVINIKGAKTRMAERLFPENCAGATPELIQNLQHVISTDDNG
ncbi:hypothetical protein EV356DRAFT_503549 [Viridothelium virens]|uniref:Uncharacterized protein n=1 Tax=Viridothelium virens TaxID=1048519 RepID=A0A6A6H649_VIRVR|nr:hypothetical protein EV356DRAFT_503549 [Viridothelium virens]